MSFYENFIFLNHPVMVKTMKDVQVWILEVLVLKPLKWTLNAGFISDNNIIPSQSVVKAVK